MLKVNDLSIYANSISIENVTFQVEQGDFFVIFGPDDSGKTELLQSIMGLTPIYNGDILFKDKPIRRLPISLRKTIRFVPDDMFLLQDLTAKQYFRHISLTYRINEPEFLQSLVQYFDIDIKERLSQMTYETNKLVAIIGAMMTFPEFLILDEPFNFLTSDNITKLLSLLNRFNQKGMTILIASENFEDLDNNCNRMMYINDGKIIQKCKVRKNTTSYKSITIKGTNFKSIEKQLGAPYIINGNYRTYICSFDIETISNILKKNKIADENVSINAASIKDALDYVTKLANKGTTT